MNDRIERVLDGELGREELSAAELRELEHFESAVGTALRDLVPEETPDVSTAVLWRIRRLEPVPAWLPGPFVPAWQGLGRTAAWLWQPRAVALRPALAMAALAVLLALPIATLQLDRTPAPVAGERPLQPLLVQFRLGAEGARNVALAGDFTEWQARHELEEIAPGVWSIVIPLEPGVYDYQFVIDGETWTIDPLAPAVADGFGGSNSRVAVMTANGNHTL